jgi:hypothetical protein
VHHVMRRCLNSWQTTPFHIRLASLFQPFHPKSILICLIILGLLHTMLMVVEWHHSRLLLSSLAS